MQEENFDRRIMDMIINAAIASQEFMRFHMKELWCVSLRDINRLKIILFWYY